MKVITGPLVEPVSLAEVKAQLGISDTLSDELLSRRIKEARIYAENYTRRPIIRQTMEMRWDRFPIEMELPCALTVVSVKYVDNDGILQTVSADDYTLDAYDEKLPVLKTAYSVVWPIPRNEKNAVRVQFTAGFGLAAEVPGLMKEALILLVGHLTNYQRQLENGATVAHVPRAIERLFDPFALTRYEL